MCTQCSTYVETSLCPSCRLKEMARRGKAYSPRRDKVTSFSRWADDVEAETRREKAAPRKTATRKAPRKAPRKVTRTLAGVVKREEAPPAPKDQPPVHYEGVVYHPGARVRHATFGPGTLLEVTGSGQDTKATVRFDVGGRKKLLLRLAKLEVV